MKNLKDWIKEHEGLRLKPYKDTVNKTTIGYGRNLQDNGITPEEADYLFNNDLQRCLNDLNKFKWYTEQPNHIKDALTDMCFNLGINRLRGFKKMIAAIEAKDYTKAAIEALNSKWATQVGRRAKNVALKIRQG